MLKHFFYPSFLIIYESCDSLLCVMRRMVHLKWLKRRKSVVGGRTSCVDADHRQRKAARRLQTKLNVNILNIVLTDCIVLLHYTLLFMW